MIQPWPRVRSRQVGDFRIFTIRADTRVSPRTGTEHDFFVIDTFNWVNVIALTRDQQLVFVEQYRHGTDTVELEIPGGVMDAADASPEMTGARELREETGYAGDKAQVIGRIHPNPAIMSNVCHTVLIENSELRHPTRFDHTEDLITHLVPLGEVRSLVAAGKVSHSLVVVALYHFELWRARRMNPDAP